MESEALAQGDLVGRFVVLGELGRGGMGVVLSAYDPELDRRVALKVLRPQRATSSEARERLMREAKAMAKLRHPNTVTVYEVGTHDGQVFLAMEFASGGTLREWMQEERTQAETLGAFIAAGRGLEAAHDAGLIHRDFKPENVLVGDSGVVQVTDFGLVGAPGDGASAAGVEDVEAAGLTQAGSVLGTPAYMSPEQHRGERLDARTDQFAFCVALWEALHGSRPFLGDTLGDLRASILGDAEPVTPAGARAPTWIRNILRRGLEKKREDRFESMTELLGELDRRQDDAEIGRRTRSMLIGLMGSIWTLAPLYMALVDAELPTITSEIIATFVLATLAIGGAVWGRDTLGATLFNRQMVALIFVIFPLELVLIAGVAIADFPLAVLHQMSFFAWFILGLICVIFLERRLALSALGYLIAFLIVGTDDQLMWWAMVSCNGILMVNCLWVWRPRHGILGRFKRAETRHRGLISATTSSLALQTVQRTSLGAPASGAAADSSRSAEIIGAADTAHAVAHDETQLPS